MSLITLLRTPSLGLLKHFLNKCVLTRSGSEALCSSRASLCCLTLSLTISTWQADWWNMLCRLELNCLDTVRPDRALTQGSTCVFLRVCWQVRDCSRGGEGRRVGQGWLVQQHGSVIKDNSERLKKDDYFRHFDLFDCVMKRDKESGESPLRVLSHLTCRL